MMRVMDIRYCNPISDVLSFLPFTDKPKEPFSTRAGGNDVLYKAGYNAEIIPVKMAIKKVMAINIILFDKDISTLSNTVKDEWDSKYIVSIASKKATVVNTVASRSWCNHRIPFLLPSTFRVFIDRIFMGINDMEKLMKLTIAISIISMPTARSEKTVTLFPFGSLTLVPRK